jgi:hypothetical protein
MKGRGIIFWFNDISTRKRFTMRRGETFYCVSSPEAFYYASLLFGYDPFLMACLDGYKQQSSGKWIKIGTFPFADCHKALRDAGILDIDKCKPKEDK